MIKYIIDLYLTKGYDIETANNNSWKPIHFICRYSSPEMIKYIIDLYLTRGYDIKAATNDNWKPIHFICRYSTPELIKYIIEFGSDLEACTIIDNEEKDNNCNKPIHTLFKNKSINALDRIDIIDLMVDHGLDLNDFKENESEYIRSLIEYKYRPGNAGYDNAKNHFSTSHI
jgi:ankyrin repeat protein